MPRLKAFLLLRLTFGLGWGLAALAPAALLASCSTGAGLPGRFTYIVKYSVSGTIGAAVDVAYTTDAAGTTVTAAGQSTPWSVELTKDFDYGPPPFLVPSMRVTSPTLADGEAVTLTISWEDYQTGFREEILAQHTASNTSGSPIALDETLYGPPLPP
jgi:hypothetical protein